MSNDLPSFRVRDLGEQGLLRRLQRFCPPEIVGDDAAVLTTEPGQSLVVTTDMLVDGVHFSTGLSSTQEICTTSSEDVGWRAAAVNLSDLAAMGATPLGLTVSLGVSGDVPVTWLEGFYQGLTECLGQYKTVVVGGDICRSTVITLAITAFGQVSPNQVIRRSVAQPGDAILVTGVHGASRAGLELLLHPEFGQNLGAADQAALIRAHQRPQPRLDIPPQLWQLGPQSLRVAGMDSSDGLADAVLQICRASRVGARVERHQIPIPPALTITSLVSPEQALEWALYGGEDFELVLCLPPEVADQVVIGSGAIIIGSIVKGSEVQLVDSTGHAPVQILTLSQGFQHF